MLTLGVCEAGGRGNVPFFVIAMGFDEFVEAARTWLGIGKLGPAGILLPKRADTLFELGVYLRHLKGVKG